MMKIFDPDRDARIQLRAALGEFESAEAGARQFLYEALVERARGEHDEMLWAQAYVDEALAEVARGEEMSFAEHKARNAARLAAHGKV